MLITIYSLTAAFDEFLEEYTSAGFGSEIGETFDEFANAGYNA